MFGRFAPSEIHDRGTLLPFSDSLLTEFSEVRSPLVFVGACQRLGDGSAVEWCCDTRSKGAGSRSRWGESPRRLLARLVAVRTGADTDSLRCRTRRGKPLECLGTDLPSPCAVGCVGGRSDRLSTTSQPRRLVHLGPRLLFLAG